SKSTQRRAGTSSPLFRARSVARLMRSTRQRQRSAAPYAFTGCTRFAYEASALTRSTSLPSSGTTSKRVCRGSFSSVSMRHGSRSCVLCAPPKGFRSGVGACAKASAAQAKAAAKPEALAAAFFDLTVGVAGAGLAVRGMDELAQDRAVGDPVLGRRLAAALPAERLELCLQHLEGGALGLHPREVRVHDPVHVSARNVAVRRSLEERAHLGERHVERAAVAYEIEPL